MNNKRRNQIGGIKPVGTPIPHIMNQVIVKELALKTLAKLNPAATKNTGVFAAGLGFQTKEVAKEKEKGEFQGKFHKDEQRQKDERWHWEQDGSS